MSAPVAAEREVLASHGRGGAGNISKEDPTKLPKPEDLVTPTLKSDTYTTGRGGTGNMARNDPDRPEVARAAQDVDVAPPTDVPGPTHYGRGGAANVLDKDGLPRKSGDAKRKSTEVKGEEGTSKGLVAKLKEAFAKILKK
ncbi:hypothetical protein IQ07DRAFT_597638 [Pyrenochaeta sp. DS3sAY3a]|nr:hypothetical protein IQ07DRAFT_597638 [Pyrenochaeta sp. DS3sAY3a]